MNMKMHELDVQKYVRDDNIYIHTYIFAALIMYYQQLVAKSRLFFFYLFVSYSLKFTNFCGGKGFLE